MRLHVGSGTVYLADWLNVDVPGPGIFLAADRPDLVEMWLTTEENYYGRHQSVSIESLREGPRTVETACDRYGTFDFLPVGERVDEVLSRQSFEHLSAAEARAALRSIHGVLKPGGKLRIDVPDHAETLQLLARTRDPFYIRHILGPKRNEHGVHMQSYTRDGLRELVEGHGFTMVAEERNIHLYPAFCLRFERI